VSVSPLRQTRRCLKSTGRPGQKQLRDVSIIDRGRSPLLGPFILPTHSRSAPAAKAGSIHPRRSAAGAPPRLKHAVHGKGEPRHAPRTQRKEGQGSVSSMIAFWAAEVAVRLTVIATEEAFAFRLHHATASRVFAYLLPDKRQSVRRSGKFKCQRSRSRDSVVALGDRR
jgi:hypothetical protein